MERRAPRERAGFALVVCSALGFAAMGVFAKLAYDEGMGVTTLLTVRFVLSAAVFWLLLALRRARISESRRALPAPSRRVVLAALGLGGVAYAAEAGTFFAALERIDLSLASLLLYTYPALVTLGAFALGRERPDRRRLLALAAASAGLVLVLAGAGTGALDPLGVALALGAAIGYSAYILGAEGLSDRVDPWLMGALVITGAAVSLVVAGLVTGAIDLGFGAAGWLIVAAMALISTVMAISCFFAGIERIGGSRASIVSTVEPPATLLLAFLIFGEQLGAVQLLGGALVLAAIVVLHAPLRSRPRDPAALPADQAAARARA